MTTRLNDMRQAKGLDPKGTTGSSKTQNNYTSHIQVRHSVKSRVVQFTVQFDSTTQIFYTLLATRTTRGKLEVLKYFRYLFSSTPYCLQRIIRGEFYIKNT